MASIYLDWARTGALPSCDMPPGTRWLGAYRLETDNSGVHHWVHDAGLIIRGRLFISAHLDVWEEEPKLEGVIRSWFGDAEDWRDLDGTLVASLQFCRVFDNGMVSLTGGIQYLPDCICPEAYPLDGASPADLVFKLCSMAGEDSNRLHPALQGVLRRFIEARDRAEEQRRQDVEASKKAKLLFLRHLSDQQRADFESSGVFYVQLPDGRRFRFCEGQAHNVHLLDENERAVVEYCLISIKDVPMYDQLLAQKLILESATELFFQLANYREIKATAEPRLPPWAALDVALERMRAL